MNEQRIEELKNALREIVALITTSGKPMSPEVKQMLANVMEHVANRIQQLRTEESPVEELEQPPPELPQVEPAGFPSSQIHAFKYDPKNKNLVVKFQDKYPGTNGPVYSYSGVPEFIFDVFRRGAVAPKTSGQNAWHRWKRGVTPSLGASMAALIKNGGFQYKRLS